MVVVLSACSCRTCFRVFTSSEGLLILIPLLFEHETSQGRVLLSCTKYRPLRLVPRCLAPHHPVFGPVIRTTQPLSRIRCSSSPLVRRIPQTYSNILQSLAEFLQYGSTAGCSRQASDRHTSKSTRCLEAWLVAVRQTTETLRPEACLKKIAIHPFDFLVLVEALMGRKTCSGAGSCEKPEIWDIGPTATATDHRKFTTLNLQHGHCWWLSQAASALFGGLCCSSSYNA